MRRRGKSVSKRHAAKLSKQSLESIREILYPGGFSDAEWGADELDSIARVLRDYGLTRVRDVRKALSAIDIVLNRVGADFRVNFRGGREATAYYTSDLSDALQTGIAMSKEGRR